MELITTRTQANVSRVAALRARIAAGMATEAERLEYLYGDTEAAESLDGYFLADSTGEALELYSGEQKGAYNAIDLNRVESAVEELQEAMNAAPEGLQALADSLGVAWDGLYELPFGAFALETRTDWAEADLPTELEMERYLTNVRQLVTALGLAAAVLPSSMGGLTWQGANRIEEMLIRGQASLETLIQTRAEWITNTAAAWFYAGDLYAGEI